MPEPRHDFREPGRPKFGKPGTSYPQSSFAHPTITEQRVARKGSAQTPDPFGNPHPDSATNPNAYLTLQQSDQGDDNDKKVTEVYETLPGPLLTGATQTQDGVAGTLTMQRVKAGASADTGADVLDSTIQMENAVVGVKTTRTGVLWSSSGSVVSDSTLGATGTISEAIASAPSVSSGFNVVSSTADPNGPLRWNNKTLSVSDWPTLTGNELSTLSRAGHLMRFVSTINRTETTDRVAPGTTTAGGFLVLESETKPETKDRSIMRVVTVPGFETITNKSFDEFGTLETTTETIVDPSTAISQSGSSIQELNGIDSYRSLLTTKSLTVDGGGNLVSAIVTEIEKVDRRVPGSRATVYYYLVEAGSSIPNDTLTTTYVRRRYLKNPSMKIEVKTVYAIPSTYVEYRDMSYPFPALFTSYYSDNVQGTTRIQRGGFSANVPHKITHSFSITPPTDTGGGANVPVPYQIIEQDQLLFSIPVHALKDDTTASTTVDGVTYTQDSPASIPTKSAYEALIGSHITVGGSSEVWNASIYETITIEVKLQ